MALGGGGRIRPRVGEAGLVLVVRHMVLVEVQAEAWLIVEGHSHLQQDDRIVKQQQQELLLLEPKKKEKDGWFQEKSNT